GAGHAIHRQIRHACPRLAAPRSESFRRPKRLYTRQTARARSAMLDHVTPGESIEPGQDQVAIVVALLLVGNGVSATELSSKVLALSSAIQEPAAADALLTRVAELGLVRIARHAGEGRFFLT